jgi:hypothetical protein
VIKPQPSKVFNDINIDPRNIIEGSIIPEGPVSGYTTGAESVEKT